MTIQTAIASILDQPVFGGELYYIQHPAPDGSEVAQTYGVFSIIGGPSFQDLEGDTNLSRPRVQVSIYSTDANDLIAKVAAVQDAMQAANDADVLTNYSASVPVDGYEQETFRFYSHLDFNCWSTQ